MMITRLLTVCAVVTAGAAAASCAQAQQVYPAPPGTVYSPAPAPYPRTPNAYPGDYRPGDYRRNGPGAPDFDALDDDEANAGALPPPGPPLPRGPILSPQPIMRRFPTVCPGDCSRPRSGLFNRSVGGSEKRHS